MHLQKNSNKCLKDWHIFRGIKVFCFVFVSILLTWRMTLFVAHGKNYCKYLLLNGLRITSYDNLFLECIDGLHKRKEYFPKLMASQKTITFVGNAVVQKIFLAFSKTMKKLAPREINKVLCYVRSKKHTAEDFASAYRFWNSYIQGGYNASNETRNCPFSIPAFFIFGEPQANQTTVQIREVEPIGGLEEKWSNLSQHTKWKDSGLQYNVANFTMNVLELKGMKASTYKFGSTERISTTATTAGVHDQIARRIIFLIADRVPECCDFFQGFEGQRKRCALFFSLCFTISLMSKICRWLMRKIGESTEGDTINDRRTITSVKNIPSFLDKILADTDELTNAFARLGLMLFYLYVTSCTPTLGYEKKTVDNTLMAYPLLVYTCIALLSVTHSENTGTNNVHITKEWRGWMQLYIIHTHRSQFHKGPTLLGISLARIFVSAYFFLSGYGHFCYFWRRPMLPYGLVDLFKLKKVAFVTLLQETWLIFKRYIQVAFRLNILVLFVSLMTGRLYAKFYFMTLIFIWFTIIVFTMATIPRVTGTPAAGMETTRELQNEKSSSKARSPDAESRTIKSNLRDTENLCLMGPSGADHAKSLSTPGSLQLHQFISAIIIMAAKLLILVYLVRKMCQSRNSFMKAVKIWPMKFIFTGAGFNFWYWRFSNDAYIFIYGMTFGLFSYGVKYIIEYFRRQHDLSVNSFIYSYGRKDLHVDIRCSRSFKGFHEQWKKLLWLVLETAVTGAGVVIIYVSIKHYMNCKDTVAVHVLNIHFSIVPIMAYIVVRNTMTSFRQHHSQFLEYLGGMSMELYIIHMVERGRLILIPGAHFKLVNEFLYVLILITICHETHHLTNILQAHLVPKSMWAAFWTLAACYFFYRFLCNG